MSKYDADASLPVSFFWSPTSQLYFFGTSYVSLEKLLDAHSLKIDIEPNKFFVSTDHKGNLMLKIRN